ncbi:MAG TPA: type II toxin-antitoxin system RelE/ParE family toxin [Flavobacteriia bacterium]|nr:type II toxin-antitoxin system RelE/ParE family toxin [Flavobacteriia bacterium]
MSKKNKYLLSVRSKEDLRGIALYTIEKFGIEQSKKYAIGLEKALEFLSENPNHGKRYLSTGKKMLFRYRYISHVIFYYPTASGIFIVRVLGERMNFLKHIK